MMVLWERHSVSEKELGEALFLKSNTLTLLLQKLKKKGLVTICKDKNDGRSIVITLTERGEALKEKAVDVPTSIVKSIHLSEEEGMYLYRILYKILEANQNEEL
jgi:DNA-binding MarR family transcriptional regulator